MAGEIRPAEFAENALTHATLAPDVRTVDTAPNVEPVSMDRPSLWRDRLYWLTLLLTLPAIAPFLLPGYFWGANDARHHVYFLFEFDRLVIV